MSLKSFMKQYGEPNLLISGMTNPKWPEIESQLLKGQMFKVRPDIVSKVFINKLFQLEANLRNRKHFEGHVIEYLFFTVTFSFIGLPEFHMALKLHDIVSHNPELFLEWDGQVSVQYITSGSCLINHMLQSGEKTFLKVY